MPLFIPINNINANSNNYTVKELNIHKINKDAIKYTIAAFTKSLNPISKE